MRQDSTSIGFEWPLRIYFEDTDAGGIVYHANYLKFMERARTEWLRNLGFEQNDLASEFRIAFVVSKIAIDYLIPARFNDSIVVCSRVERLKRMSIEFEQNVKSSDKTLTRARVKVGCIDTQSYRPREIPRKIYQEIGNAGG